MSILLLIDGMLYKYQLGSSGLMFPLRSVLPWFFCLDDLSIDVKCGVEVLHYCCIIVDFPFMAVSICLTYSDAPMLGEYTFTIIISSSWIYPLITM